MMKALKAQSKAGNAARLSRIIGGSKGNPSADADDGKPVAKAKRPSAPMSVEGKAARPRLDRPGRKMGGRTRLGAGGAAPDDLQLAPYERGPQGPWLGEGDSGRSLKEDSSLYHQQGGRYRNPNSQPVHVLDQRSREVNELADQAEGRPTRKRGGKVKR